MEGREERGFVIFGNRRPWRKGISFSQGTGPFVVAWFIGFTSIAKGRGIDREAAEPPSTVFLFDIRDRG
jgi:hypothetical protein